MSTLGAVVLASSAAAGSAVYKVSLFPFLQRGIFWFKFFYAYIFCWLSNFHLIWWPVFAKPKVLSESQICVLLFIIVWWNVFFLTPPFQLQWVSNSKIHTVHCTMWTLCSAMSLFLLWRCIRYDKKKGWIQGHNYGRRGGYINIFCGKSQFKSLKITIT